MSQEVPEEVGGLAGDEPGDGAQARPSAAVLRRARTDASAKPWASNGADDVPAAGPGLLVGGATRLGRFEIGAQLGHGGMGVVYAARDTATGQVVALKTLRSLDGRYLYRLKREFRALCEFRHPNVVAYRELHLADGHWFVTMDLIDGEPFDRYVRPRGVLHEARLRASLAQLAEALSAVHRFGKLHRDLKPSNVLVSRAGEVRLLDFGLVVGAGFERSTDGGFGGTLAYMAPEQALGERGSAASDWYAFGLMLFEALTGQLPHRGDSLALLDQKRRGEVPTARALCPQAPADLDALCARLLQRDPSRRPLAPDVFRALCYRPGRTQSPRVSGAAPFVGRAAQHAVLAQSLAQVFDGRSASVLVSGESGIGKTSLVERFCGELDDDVLVLRGRCSELEQMPYKVLDGVVDALVSHLRRAQAELIHQLIPRHADALVRVFPVLKRLSPFATVRPTRHGNLSELDMRNAAFLALRELFQRLCDFVTTVVVVDDLQWGDVDSARLLGSVMAAPDAPALLLIGVHRDVPDSAFLTRIALDPAFADARRLHVGPLSDAEGFELAERLLGGSVPASIRPLAQTLLAEAGGMPFLVTELIGHLRERLSRSAPAGSAHTALGPLLHGRLAAISEAAVVWMQVLSLAGQPLPYRVVCQTVGVDAGDDSLLHALRRERFVRIASDAVDVLVEPYHDRVREWIVAGLGPEERRGLHARLSSVLERTGDADPELLLSQFLGAGMHARAEAAALSAARNASRALAFERAAHLFQQTALLAAERGPLSHALLGELSLSFERAGDAQAAAEGYRRAAAAASGPEAIGYRLRATQQWLRAGRDATGLASADELLREVGEQLPRTTAQARRLLVGAVLKSGFVASSHSPRSAQRPQRVEVLSALSQELFFSRPTHALAFHARYFAAVRTSADAREQARANAWHAMHMGRLGGPIAGRLGAAALRRLRGLVRESSDPELSGLERLATSLCLGGIGDFSGALGPAEEAEQIFVHYGVGTYWERSATFMMRSIGLEYISDAMRLRRLIDAKTRDMVGRGEHFPQYMLLLSRAFVLLSNDEPEECLAYLEPIDLEGPLDWACHSALHRTLDALIYLGRGQEALALLQHHWARLTRSEHYEGQVGRAWIHCTRARVAAAAYAGAPDPRLARQIRRDVRSVRRLGTGFTHFTQCVEATLRHLEGDRRGAIEGLQRALSQAERGNPAALYARVRLAEICGTGIEEAWAPLLALGVKRPDRATAYAIGGA